MDFKKLRQDIDGLLFQVEDRQKAETQSQEHNRCMALVRTKLQEARMWAGKVLEAESKPFPEEFRDHCEERKKE